MEIRDLSRLAKKRLKSYKNLKVDDAQKGKYVYFLHFASSIFLLKKIKSFLKCKYYSSLIISENKR